NKLRLRSPSSASYLSNDKHTGNAYPKNQTSQSGYQASENDQCRQRDSAGDLASAPPTRRARRRRGTYVGCHLIEIWKGWWPKAVHGSELHSNEFKVECGATTCHRGT